MSVTDQEVWLVTPTTLDLGVPSCDGNPVIDRLEETEDQVRIQVVTTTQQNGDRLPRRDPGRARQAAGGP